MQTFKELKIVEIQETPKSTFSTINLRPSSDVELFMC